jgi:hypothetical protein
VVELAGAVVMNHDYQPVAVECFDLKLAAYAGKKYFAD